MHTDFYDFAPDGAAAGRKLAGGEFVSAKLARPIRSTCEFADPVTGSSAMPACAPNHRDTKSMPGPPPAAVTIRPRTSSTPHNQPAAAREQLQLGGIRMHILKQVRCRA